MQKARQNIRVKWMLEDFINEVNGCNNVGYQRPHMRKVIDHFNRDRAGGHRHTDLKIKSVENIFTDEVGTARRKSIKKVNRKAQRINQKKAARKALADYEWCNEPDEFSHMFNEIQAYDDWMDLYDEEWERSFANECNMDWDDQSYDYILEHADWNNGYEGDGYL